MANEEIDDEMGAVTLWTGIKYGTLFVAVGFGVLLLFMLLESSERGVRVPAIIALAYYIGGKWTIAGFCWFLALVFYILGIRDHFRNKD